MKNTILFTILALGSMGFAAKAQEFRDSALIYFHQSKATLDTSYRDNGKNLERLLENIDSNLNPDSNIRISTLRVVGSASPEGSVAINRKLSERRAKTIFDYFSQRTNLPDSLTDFAFIGRDWNGLKSMVMQDANVPYREDVIALLTEICGSVDKNGKDTEANLLRLKGLQGGIPYRYMYARMFPTLRASRLFIGYDYPQLKKLRLIGPDIDYINLTAKPEPATYIGEAFPVKQKCRHPFYMDVRTNLLSDALALPNIGVEFYVGKKWSVIADWTYGWWDIDRKHRYWRAYGGNVGVRRWFGKKADEKPLTGHHLGIYGGVITYDFEFGGKGYMGGLPDRTLWDRCNYLGGIEYGYSLPVAKRINIDFTIGVGYMGGKFIEYVPRGREYVYQKTRTLNWVGPTKAEISLVWLIGCDNYNRMKGGEK